MRVALTYNLKPTSPVVTEPAEVHDTYAEWDDVTTITAVREALATEHEVMLVEAGREIEQRLLAARPHMVFNLAEGLGGPEREAIIPAILQRRRIPFTGSSAQTLRVCLDKAATKSVLRQHGLPTPDYMIARGPDAVRRATAFPVIVKPLHEGSSKGIYCESVVYDRCALRRQVQRVVETYGQPVLVENFLPGREFTVALLGNGPYVRVLPLIEICFDPLPSGAEPIYSYEAKWLWDAVTHPLEILACPAPVDPNLADTLASLSQRAFRALGCRDWCRIDLRLDAQGRPFILEVNPLPGILPDPDSHSCFPKAAAAAGLGYPELIRRVLHLACERHGLQP